MISSPRSRRPSRLERALVAVGIAAIAIAVVGLTMLIVILLLEVVGA